MATISPLLALSLLLAVIVIGHDLYARRVPNQVLLGILAMAVLWQLAGLIGWVTVTAPSLAQAGLAFGLALVVTLPFYAFGWMGAGDVKMLAVLGFVLGLKPVFIVWVLANVLVAIHAVAIVGMRAAFRLQPQLAVLQSGWQRSAFHLRLQQPRQRRKGLPFAAYLGIGVFGYVFFAPWLETLL